MTTGIINTICNNLCYIVYTLILFWHVSLSMDLGRIEGNVTEKADDIPK